MIRSSDVVALTGAAVAERNGRLIGTVGQVYSSEDGGQPLFVTVRFGTAGPADSLVPLESAEFRDGTLRLAFDRDTIADAPAIDADDGISDDERGTVFDYYDSSAGGAPSGTADEPAGLAAGGGSDRSGDDARSTSGSAAS